MTTEKYGQWHLSTSIYKKQCKVQDKLIVGLYDRNAMKAKEMGDTAARDSTTFIYHSKKI